MVVLEVNGQSLPNPDDSGYSISYKDLDSDNSYTSETGILNRDMIRANHVTIACKWSRLTQTQCMNLLQAISGKESIQLKYYDYMSMTYKTGKFYSSDRSTSGVRISSYRGRFTVSFNFIEF